MKWLDVAGPPGCGKSTLCYPVWGDKSVTWDGQLPPAYWRPFLDEITALIGIVRDHPSIEAVIRMNDRSAKKMATVERMEEADLCSAGIKPDVIWGKCESRGTFVQTGLVQRILGFGWRLTDMKRDVNLIRRALWLMPVSVGAAFLEADDATIFARNKAREANPATAHENRSFQVPLMRPAIAIAKEVLHDRGVPIIDIDVQHQPVSAARYQLLDFADQEPCHAVQVGSGREMALLSPHPPWWRS
jgi:hypothetical protein